MKLKTHNEEEQSNVSLMNRKAGQNTVRKI